MIRALALGSVVATLPAWLGTSASPVRADPAPVVAGEGAVVGPGSTQQSASHCVGGRSDVALVDVRQVAERLLRCLSPLVTARPATLPGEAVLTARRLVLTGVLVDVVSHGSGAVLRVRAARVQAEGAVFRFPGARGAASGVLRAPRLVLDGPVEVRARQVQGVLLGLLPVVLEAHRPGVLAGAPLLVPWLEIRDARVSGASVRAASAGLADAALEVHPARG